MVFNLMRLVPIAAFLAATVIVTPGCVDPERPVRSGPLPRIEPGMTADSDASNGPRPEVISLLGRPLFALDPGANTEQEWKLAAARERFDRNRDDPDARIWVGRRLGYLLRIREALGVYSDGIDRHRDDARLYRHRGHRFITIRKFEEAAADLERAADLIRDKTDRIEPDGMPNKRNLPLTTTGFNVWYHLGLARYLEGDYDGARSAYSKTYQFSRKYDDNMVATTYWMYLTMRRLGRPDEAARLLDLVSRDMTIIENHAYHRLVLLFKGELEPDTLLQAADDAPLAAATMGYGLGMYHLLAGRTDQAIVEFDKVVSSDQWAAFGFIAAEVELVRIRAEQRAASPPR